VVVTTRKGVHDIITDDWLIKTSTDTWRRGDDVNIGVVHWSYLPTIGGVETHLATICPEMAKLGTEVYLLTSRRKGAPDREGNLMNVTRSDILDTALLESMKEKGQAIPDYARPVFMDFLTRNRVNVVHAHNLHMDYFPVSKTLVDMCHERGVPCVLILHNDVFIDRDEAEMTRILTEVDWDKLVAISNFVKDSVQRRVPAIPEEKFQVILHGIDTDSFFPASRVEKEELKRQYGFGDNRVVLHTARFLRWKGIIPAIQSLPAIIERFPDVKMVLTGRKERVSKEDLKQYEQEIDRTIVELGLEKNVHIGMYSYSDIPRLTRLADVVIYTTIGDEPFGLVPVEAMASGVPTIVTRSGGLIEGVVDGETGFIIDKDEQTIPAQLATRIVELFSHEGLAGEVGSAGRRRAVEVFDKERMAADLIHLSNSLVS
jgi:glycosyltransferase involved in cell wall biosynthesis